EGKIINLWEDDNDEADQYANSGLLSNQNDEELTSKPTLFTANIKEPEKQIRRWRVCIDYRELNESTRKYHFPLPFIDQMLKSLSRNEYYCFLDGFSGYFQIPLALEDQEKTTFTCLYETFAYRRMPFGLCNAPATFQRCMTAIFHDMCKEFIEVFMDDFSIFVCGKGDDPVRSTHTSSPPSHEWNNIVAGCKGSSPLTQPGLADFVPSRVVSDAAHHKRVKYDVKFPFHFVRLGN
ncbi:reverse transcriptase domain-containing protein, partial [Tanacetum coccineum]